MYYRNSADAVIKELGSGPQGLSSAEAAERLQKQGTNEIKQGKKDSPVVLFLKQFNDFLMYLLLFATAISIFLSEYIDAIAMLSIAILSAILGFIQEYRANKAMEALQKLSAPHATVIRDGNASKIPARDLVLGDIILLEAGDIVPADCRIIESSNFEIDEASLTGESVASKKSSKEIDHDVPITDQHCMTFMTTPVTYGKAKCVVTSTGMNTEIGKIASSIQAAEDTSAPLQIKFKQMAKQIGIAVIVLIAIVFIVSLMHKDPQITVLEAIPPLLIFALSLAVAAIPNSLPAIVTISLSLGAKILAQKNMIIKKLPATESLGSVTVICTDKTGTITKNEMTVTKIFFANKIIDVTGTGYAPVGDFTSSGKKFDPVGVELLLRIGYLCNNSKLVQQDGKYSIIGDPTEGSLVVLAKKSGLDGTFNSKFASVQELPFDSERKRMSVIFENKTQKNARREAYVKGAPDLLLERCTKIYMNGKVRKITSADKKSILAANHDLATKALRVLAFAYKEINAPKQNPRSKSKTTPEYSIDEVESSLVFVGLVGMIDPPREEVKDAVAKCKAAGIRVMVITGDHADTAKAVAEQIGLYQEGDLLVTGSDLESMSETDLDNKIEDIRIIARALPIQKLRVVNALQKKGHIVAMTGDGVNDAPALKKADIGIAMGQTGTDVAKEVSEGILTDDNFATIVNAVAEGRNIYDKIIKSTRYLLSCNAGEIVLVFTSIMANLPLPMIPLQILTMNLVTDGLPALALGTEPGDSNIMQRPPRNPKDKPINNQMLTLIVIFGVLMGLATYYLYQYSYGKAGDVTYARTMAFTTLVVLEMFAVFGSRSFTPFGRLNPFSNRIIVLAVASSLVLQVLIVYLPPLQSVFQTVPLSLMDWIEILALSTLGYLVMEFSKFFIQDKHKASGKV